LNLTYIQYKVIKVNFRRPGFDENICEWQALLIILNIFDLRVVLDCDWLAHQLRSCMERLAIGWPFCAAAEGWSLVNGTPEVSESEIRLLKFALLL